jgi:hypothetical protein
MSSLGMSQMDDVDVLIVLAAEDTKVANSLVSSLLLPNIHLMMILMMNRLA